jgi:O-antigen/teichoic acid export membrane protein
MKTEPIEVNDKPLSKVIFKSSIYNLSTKLVAKFLGLVFTIILARLLKPELFGVYGLTISVVSIFLTFADLGINTALVRYISSSLKNKEKAASYYKYLFKIKITLTLVIALILILIANPLSVFIFKKPELFYILLVSSIYLILSSLMDFFESLFYSFNEINYVTIKEAIFQISRILIVFLFLFFIAKTVLSLFLAFIVTNILVLLYLLIMSRRRYKFLFGSKKYPSKKEKKKIFSYIFYLTLANLSSIFFFNIDAILLGIFVEVSYVGFYKAAYSIAAAIAGLMAITNMLFPIFSSLNDEQSKYVFKKILHYLAVLAFPATFGLALVAKPFIIILYGKDYLPAVLPMYVLSFLILISIANIYPTFFSARGKPELPAKIMVFVSFFNLILTYILIRLFLTISPMYAILGASIATITSNYLFFIALMIAAKKKFNISPDFNSIFKPFVAGIIMVIFLVIFNNLFGLRWPLAILEVIFGAVVYFLTLIIIKGITKEDFLLIKRLMNFKTKKE